jgi:hypothetical protein
MTLEEIIQEVDDGGVFIGEYEYIKKLLKYIDSEINVPFSLIHHKAIEFKKNNNDYVINLCKK